MHVPICIIAELSKLGIKTYIRIIPLDIIKSVDKSNYLTMELFLFFFKFLGDFCISIRFYTEYFLKANDYSHLKNTNVLNILSFKVDKRRAVPPYEKKYHNIKSNVLCTRMQRKYILFILSVKIDAFFSAIF